MTGAELLVDCLVKQGVKYIFGIPGAKIDAVFDALLDSPIKTIVCRHEQNAAFMAGIYGRITGTPGVVLVTSGPGVSNLATGLLTATTEGDPIIAIGGNVARNMKLKESHQNTDNIKLMEAVTKARMDVVVTESIPEIIENAFRSAMMPKSGAVFISVPQDILKEKTNALSQSPLPAIRLGTAPEALLKQATEIINTARFPVLLFGLEASRPDNTQAIRQLLMHAPFATVGTYQAAGVISRELEPYFVGRVGLFKNQPGDALLDMADVIITIGFNPVEYDPELWNTPAPNKKIIHIDFNPAQIHTTYAPCLEIIGDIALNLTQLAPLLKAKSRESITLSIEKLQKKLKDRMNEQLPTKNGLIHPLQFIQALKNVTTDEDTIISDIGSHYMWLARYLFSYEPHHLLFSNGQQTLGVALPWAIATRLARKKGRIISVSGDGGFLFSATELETAVREQIPFVHCVWCDGFYDMVKEQELLKYKRESAVKIGAVDIVTFAKSFGATGLRVTDSNTLIDTLNHALALNTPVLIEIPIDYTDNAALFKSSYDGIGH